LKKPLSTLKELSAEDKELVTIKTISDTKGSTYFLRITEEFNGFHDCINVEVYDYMKEGAYFYKRIGLIFAEKERRAGRVKVIDFKVLKEDNGIGSVMLHELDRYISYRNKGFQIGNRCHSI
jgi:hypothetical protein